MSKSHLEMTVCIAEYHHLRHVMSESHLEQTVCIAEYRHLSQAMSESRLEQTTHCGVSSLGLVFPCLAKTCGTLARLRGWE